MQNISSTLTEQKKPTAVTQLIEQSLQTQDISGFNLIQLVFIVKQNYSEIVHQEIYVILSFETCN